MSRDVDDTVHIGPRNRWHPEYDSIREWLDALAPPEPTSEEQKKHNRPRYRRTLKRIL